MPWAGQGAVGPFSTVYVNDGLTLDFDEWTQDVPRLHYCVYWSEPDGHVWELLTVSYERQRPRPGTQGGA